MEKQTKIAVIGTVGLPANYGGFETLTAHLVKNLGMRYDMHVYCSGRRYPKKERKSYFEQAKLIYLPFDANGKQSILYDSLSILHALFYADVLLILGVAGAWLLPLVRIFTNKKIIISIDGIEWKRDKWNMLAKMYLWWAESIAVKYSHLDISDNESIQDYTARRYGTISRIIEYGADHTTPIKPCPYDYKTYPFLHQPYAFTVCRIEPENNLHLILEAFCSLPKHPLVIVGNWHNSEYGKKLRQRYACHSHITLLDPIYDQQALDLLRSNALVYIHGHSAGGTNPSLVEAMYLGLPVIAFNVSYNRTTTEGKAIYFDQSDDLRKHIEETSLPCLKKLGHTMYGIAARRYTWNRISEKYDQLFQEAIQAKTKQRIAPDVQDLEVEKLREYEAAHLLYQHLFYQKKS